MLMFMIMFTYKNGQLAQCYTTSSLKFPIKKNLGLLP